MAPHRKRNRTLRVEILETRCLLSTGGPVGVWLGQDGHDYAGGTSAGVGNGIQDMHVLIENLPTNATISSLTVTGAGGGEWDYNRGPYSAFNADVIENAGSSTADLYLDPYQTETGRQFDITMYFSDGTSDEIWVKGGAASPNLWMPEFDVSTTWIGQDGHDLTGQGPDVGPDGFQDIHLTLSNLFPGSAVSSVTVTDGSVGWASGLNPGLLGNGEFIPNSTDPTKGDFYFSPSTNLSGQTLTVTITYADGKLATNTLVSGADNPSLAERSPAPVSVNWSAVTAKWIGQDGLDLVGPGDVHVIASGIPAGQSVVSATLSDEAGADWSYLAPGSGVTQADSSSGPLGLRASTSGIDLTFPPVRSETGATLTLLVTLENGTILACRFAGGAADPGLRVPEPAATSVVAYPGDNLNLLANSYGTVHLTAGIYELNQPLILNKPVNLDAAPGVTMLFSQPANAPEWTAAIKVLASHTTLQGFAVRFAGPIQWNESVSYGPAVVGTRDDLDPFSSDPQIDESFTRLDLQAPRSSSSWEQAPGLIRMTNAQSGLISDNLLKGGETVVFNGPWQVTGNTYAGTMPDTYAYEAFASHSTHDVTFANNVIAPAASSGKTWRFLVMTQQGIGDSVVNNRVSGVGPMDSDTIPDPNADEIILTEAYSVHYEGAIGSVSANGLVVQIPDPQGGQARTGDVLSILSGPQSGQWRMIAQVINQNTYVLDSPITPGSFAVAFSTGFVNETYQGNTINMTGSSTADGLVLPGNQFGAEVIDNTFVGGNNAFQLTAYPSENPDIWGWTHVPFLGATIAGNTLDDSLNGGVIDVLHDSYAKTDVGRVYFSGLFENNIGIWDATFHSAHPSAQLVSIGDSFSADPRELVLTTSGNLAQGPASLVAAPTMSIVSGTLNGQALRNVEVVLPSSEPTIAKPKPTKTAVIAVSTPSHTPVVVPTDPAPSQNSTNLVETVPTAAGTVATSAPQIIRVQTQTTKTDRSKHKAKRLVPEASIASVRKATSRTGTRRNYRVSAR